MATRIYDVLHLKRLAGSLLVTLVLGISLAPRVQADSYNVSASIPYPTPTQAATVDNNPDGTTVNAALQTLTGTCQLQNPADVVMVWRDGTAIGSAPCNGTYSVQIMLKSGANMLTLRTANASQLYGPDSAPLTITLDLPPPPTPTPTPAGPLAPTETPAPLLTETPAQVVTSTNAGAAEDLTASSVQPFSVLSTNNDVMIQVTVGGGQTPYTIRLDWGDGSTESHSVALAGTYDFTHSYQASASYIVRGSVHDVLGASTQFMYAVTSSTPTAVVTAAAAATTATAANALGDFVQRHWKPVAGLTGAAVVAGGGYLLGAHKAVEQAVVQTGRVMRPGAKSRSKLRKRS